MRIRENIRIRKLFPGVWHPEESLKKFELGDSLSMDPFDLGKCSFYMKSFLKKYPFKGTGKPAKRYYLIMRGHEQASGVSYPSKQISAWYHTP